MKKSYTVYFLIFILTSYLSFSYEIKDSEGKIWKFNKNFHRILSLYPAHTEVLIDLGAKENIIGTSKGSYINPEEIDSIPIFSYKDSIEKFISIKPDLVLIRPMIKSRYNSLIKSLEKMGITVISIQPKNSSSLFEYWYTLGKLSGQEVEVKNYIDNFQRELNKLTKVTDSIPISKRKNIFFEARFKRGLSTCSENAMSYFILENIGVNNIFKGVKSKTKNSFISPVKQELLISKGNNIDYYISQYGAMNRREEKDILTTPGYKAIKAVRERKIYVIDEMKVSRPTYNLIEAMQEMASIIYPDYF